MYLQNLIFRSHLLYVLMQPRTYRPKDLAKQLGVEVQTLRLWETQGNIKAIKTEKGQRRYIYEFPDKSSNGDEDEDDETNGSNGIIYARVSSHKQSADLQRQIKFLRTKYPKHKVVKDIGGGVNFRRRGLQTILERAMSGTLKHVVVAHKDRLCRVGFDLLEWLFEKHGVVLEVVGNTETNESNGNDIIEDILSIITHYTAKFYGTRKYRSEGGEVPNDKVKNLSVYRNEEAFFTMLRGIEIFFQSSKRFLEVDEQEREETVPELTCVEK